MSKPENQEPWYIEKVPGKVIGLSKLDEKKSYAYFNLSATLFLQGDLAGAENEIQKLRDLGMTRQADIRALITADLDALVQANSNFAEQVKAYKQLYL
jgi:hypothetical protein